MVYVGTFLLKHLEVRFYKIWEDCELFLCEMYWNIFIDKYVILFIQEFLDTVMPVYMLKLSLHFLEVSFYKAHYNSIPELAPGYCNDVIYSVMLRSAFFISLIYHMALNVRYSVRHISNLNMQNLMKSLFYTSALKLIEVWKLEKRRGLRYLEVVETFKKLLIIYTNIYIIRGW